MVSSVSDEEIANWTIINGNSPYQSSCGSYNLFGGFNLFSDNTILYRNFTNLPNHYRFEMDLGFLSVDNFNGKVLNIYFDDVLAGTFTFQMVSLTPSGATSVYLDSYAYYFGQLLPGYFSFSGINKYGYGWIFGSNQCGGPAAEYKYILKVVGEHNSSSLSIKFNITGNVAVGSWGMQSFYYYLWSQSISTNCESNCLVCNQGNCGYCPGAINQDDVCVGTCSTSNYFLDSTSTICYTCYSSCNGCTSGSPDSCISCKTDYWHFGSYCVSSCPTGYTGNTTTMTCYQCDVTCLTCSGGLNTQCLSCSTPAVLQNNICVASCDSNYYYDSDTNQCFPCNENCLTCNGAFRTNCTSCLSNYFLISSTNQCELCDASCATCNGASNDNCLSCFGENLFSQGSCVVSCDINQYLNGTNGSCNSCDLSCASCSGPLISNCLSCLSGNFLNSLTGMCGVCDASCQSCNGPLSNNCQSCLNLLFSNGSCMNSCSTTQYINITNNSCGQCDPSCLTCIGPSVQNCTNCLPSDFLDGATNSCLICNSFCSTCYGLLQNNCLSCNHNLFLSLNSCVSLCPANQIGNFVNHLCENFDSTCPSGTFYDSTQNNCSLCDSSCLSCSGPLLNNCLSCNTNSYLLANFTCLLFSCLANEFWDPNSLNCQSCDPSCQNCSGSLNTNCLSCYSGYFFNLNQCIKINLTLIAIKNPFEFQIDISPNDALFSPQIIQVTISNFRINLFNYSITPIPFSNDFNLTFTYSDSIENSILNLQILNDSLSTALTPYTPCIGSGDFYIENGKCYPKPTFDYTWIYTDDYEKIHILFKVIDNPNNNSNGRRMLIEYDENQLNPIVEEGVQKGIFYADVEYSSLNKNFNYSFQILNDSVILFINFTSEFYGGVNINLRFNDSKFMEINDSQKINIIKKQLTLYIMDHSVSTDQSRAQLMDITQQISGIGEIAVTCLVLLSYIFNPKSSFAIRGMLLTTLFQILKYIKINYPENAMIIFTNSQENFFFKNQVIQSNIVDEALFGFPQLFLYYNTSLFLLNNISDEYVLVIVVFGGCLLIIVLKYFVKIHCLSKIIDFLHSIFVWNFLIMISFSKYISTVFFVFLSLRFGMGFNFSNTLISHIGMLYIIYLPFHTHKIIIILNKISESSPTENSNKIFLFGVETTKNFDFTSKKSKFSHHPYQQPDEEKPNSSLDPLTLASFKKKTKKIVPWDIFKEYATPTLKLQKDLVSEDVSDSNQLNSSSKYLTSPTVTKKSAILCQNNLESEKTKNDTLSDFSPENKNKEIKFNFASVKNFFIVSPVKSRNYFSKLIAFLVGPFILLNDFLYKVKDEKLFGRKFAIMKQDFRESLGLHRFYFVFDLIRYFLIPSVVVFLYPYTLIQMTIICLTNFLFFVFLIFEIPFKQKTTSAWSYLNELCINTAYFSAFALACMDVEEDRNIDLRINFGWGIVFSYIFLLFMLAINAAIRLIKGAVRFIFKMKRRRKNKKISISVF